MSLLSLSRASLLLTALLAASFSTSALAEGTIRLNFGVYSSNKPSAMVKVYRPVLKELEKNMTRRLDRNVDIRMQIAKDYDQGISHLINGRVDFSAFGPASYVEAKRMNNDISILAVENVKNSKVFYGIIAVGKESDIKDISQLRGKSFAFGDEGSTIGRFLSQLELEQAGVRAEDLNRYEYLGRHDKVGTAVGAGSFDAGALNEKTFKLLVEAGEPIRELARFPNVTKPWIARSGLDDEILQALRESLLEVNDQKTLAALKIDGFLEGTDDDYKVIRRAMDNNNIFFEEREKVQISNAVVSSPEPGLQAATSNSNAEIDISEEIRVQHDTHLDGIAVTDNRNHLTVNISLPRRLFEASNNGHALTINVTIPDEATEDVMADNLADDSQD